MPNMLYVCGILYEFGMPFVVVLNKIDVPGEEGGKSAEEEAREWMDDLAFQVALSSMGSRDGDGEPSYMASLTHSMLLVLDEFYKHLKAVAVSSLTGAGLDAFWMQSRVRGRSMIGASPRLFSCLS